MLKNGIEKEPGKNEYKFVTLQICSWNQKTSRYIPGKFSKHEISNFAQP